MKRIASALALVALAASLHHSAAAEKRVIIKLATIAPSGSTYHQSLLQMGEKWRKASNGQVTLTVYANGTQGSEADTVGLMQTKSLQASLLTVVGLSEIEPAVGALQNMPMAFRSLDEVDYVGQKLHDRLEQSLIQKGYQILFWTDSGWVRFFTTSPVVHPDDMRKLKVFTWAGSAAAVDIWKHAGFTPVALETSNIQQALMSRTISAVPVPPIFALFGQLYGDLGKAKYMLEVNWSPLVGALVVRKDVLDKIAPEVREEMIKISTEIGKTVKANGRAENDQAVEAMVKRGLVVQKLTPETEAEWRVAAEASHPLIRGKMVPADVFDQAMGYLKEFRAQGSKQ